MRQLLEEGSLHPGGIRTFIVDEADALMGGTFEADVLFIHSMLPRRKQVLAFSATYPPDMRARLSNRAMSTGREYSSFLLCGSDHSSQNLSISCEPGDGSDSGCASDMRSAATRAGCNRAGGEGVHAHAVAARHSIDKAARMVRDGPGAASMQIQTPTSIT